MGENDRGEVGEFVSTRRRTNFPFRGRDQRAQPDSPEKKVYNQIDSLGEGCGARPGMNDIFSFDLKR